MLLENIVLVHLWEQQFMELLISVKTKKFNQLDIQYDQLLVTQIVQVLNNIMILILLMLKGIQLNIQDIKIAYLEFQGEIYQIVCLLD